MSLLSVSKLTVTLQGREIFRDISFNIAAGELVGLIGANGAGKTTLMRAVLGLLPHAGNSSLAILSDRERAKHAAWLPQTREIAWPVTVENLVALGRIPHLTATQNINAHDQHDVNKALAQMALTPMRQRPATQLSGGEQARVLIARALAQNTPLLLADEPVAGLDPAHQIATMQVFATLATQGKGVLVSLHDLGLAARHCTRLILLSDGSIVADDIPTRVLSADNLARVFGIRAWVQNTDQGPIYQPLDVIH